jgi:hypothetical protein
MNTEATLVSQIQCKGDLKKMVQLKQCELCNLKDNCTHYQFELEWIKTHTIKIGE